LNGKNTGKTGNIWEFDGFSMIFLLFSRRSQKKTDMTWKNWQKNGSGIQVADHFTIFFPGLFDQRFKDHEWQTKMIRKRR